MSVVSQVSVNWVDTDSDHLVPEPEVEPNESHQCAVGVLIIADSAMAWPVPAAHSGSSFRLSGLVGLMVRNVELALVARNSG